VLVGQGYQAVVWWLTVICPPCSSQEYQNMGGDDNEVYHGIKNWRYILTSELTIRGFICGKVSKEAQTNADEGLRHFIREGKLKTE
jgi:NADPH-dependent curcumin reductase CurA